MKTNQPNIGAGLRPTPYPNLEPRPQTRISWFEAMSENYMDTKGRPLDMLELIRGDYPVALHGISLSIASTEGLRQNYLQNLHDLVKRIDPFIVLDHLCWTGLPQENLHDLLPIPFTEEALDLIVAHVDEVQTWLQRPILLENVSTYLRFPDGDYTEWEFLQAVADRSGCQILLDLNNLYVNAHNHHYLFAQASRRSADHSVECGRLGEILPGGSLTSGAALEVFRTGHIVRLTEALGETFEAIWWVAGDDHYFQLAKEFLLSHPSTSYNLSDFGQSFPEFLDQRHPFSDLLFLPDLARFEGLFKEVFHLPPHTGLTQDQFQHFPLSGDLRLTFGPSVRLFRSPYSVYEIWKLRRTIQESLPEEVRSTPQWLLLYKQQQQVHIKHLSKAEYLLLHHLHSGASIEESLDRKLQELTDITATTASDVFKLITLTGIVTHLTTRFPT